MKEPFSDYITDMCADGAKKMSDLSKIMLKSASQDQELDTVARETVAGKTSYFKAMGSMLAQSDASSYFNMSRAVALDKEKGSANKIFEYDEAVKEYKINSSSNTTLSYYYKTSRYVGGSPNLTDVYYYANSNFITILAGKMYAMTMLMDQSQKSKCSLDDTSSLALILARSDSEAEVFAVSSQLGDNESNHNAVISEGKKYFREEQLRSFKNSAKASQANKFFE
jgi:hypothetical protein